MQFSSCNFRLIFWSLLVKIHLRKEVSREVVMQWSVTEGNGRTAWELSGLLDTAQNDISFATWIERPWFQFKVLCNVTLPSCLLLYFHLLFYPPFIQHKNKTCKIFSMCFSPSALTTSSIWPHLSSSYFLKQSDNLSHFSLWMTPEDTTWEKRTINVGLLIQWIDACLST